NIKITTPSGGTPVKVTLNYDNTNTESLGNLTASGTVGVKYTSKSTNGISLADSVNAKVAEQKAKGNTVKDWGGFSTSGAFPNKDTTYTITFNAPVPKKKTVTVRVEYASFEGGTGAQSFTSTAVETTRLSAAVNGSVLTDKVQKQVDAYKKLSYTKIDWDGWDKAKSGTYGAAKSSYTIKMTPIWQRLWGAGPLDTMRAIVKEGWKDNCGGTVVIATRASYYDALSASGVAGLFKAPILVTDKANLSAQTSAELQRIRPTRVIIAGGPLAVTDTVKNQIKSVTGVEPKRIYGANPVGTANQLNREYKTQWKDGIAILATQKTFHDALSAAPVAYAKHYPIFLASNANTIDPTTIAAMRECGVTRVMIVGGTAVIGAKVEQDLRNAGLQIYDRHGGVHEFATSKLIAEWGLSHGMTANKMAVATQYGFSDALCGAALCGKNNSVLVLANNKSKSNASVSKAYKSQISHAYVFGGPIAVEKDTWDAFVASTA
ncbi:MAG: cell wall-binding repeat-containing protein, partial [Eggerthellaceae bacterium]|nr:cell wall-binding repeat-containing protein [Eggerthellaceae bacterium]